MIKIIRYSQEGFKSQKQTHHIKEFEYWESFDPNREDISEFMRECCMKTKKEKVKFYYDHFEDLQEGLWFFLDGHKNRQSLNHLDRPVPCWEGEIDEHLLVYDCNLTSIISLSDSLVMMGGYYIPKRLVTQIKNIHKKKNKIPFGFSK